MRKCSKVKLGNCLIVHTTNFCVYLYSLSLSLSTLSPPSPLNFTLIQVQKQPSKTHTHTHTHTHTFLFYSSLSSLLPLSIFSIRCVPVDDGAILDVQFTDFSYPAPDGFDRIMFEKSIYEAHQFSVHAYIPACFMLWSSYCLACLCRNMLLHEVFLILLTNWLFMNCHGKGSTTTACTYIIMPTHIRVYAIAMFPASAKF